MLLVGRQQSTIPTQIRIAVVAPCYPDLAWWQRRANQCVCRPKLQQNGTSTFFWCGVEVLQRKLSNRFLARVHFLLEDFGDVGGHSWVVTGFIEEMLDDDILPLHHQGWTGVA